MGMYSGVYTRGVILLNISKMEAWITNEKCHDFYSLVLIFF